MTSPLTTRFSALLDATYTALIAGGHPYNRLTTPELHYLATTLTSLRGSPASELSLGTAQLLCGIANAADGGSRSPNTVVVADLLAACCDALYVAPAVNFDNSTPGSVFLHSTSLACDDTGPLSLSAWVKMATNGNGNNLYVSAPVGEYGTYFQISSTFDDVPIIGALETEIANSSGGAVTNSVRSPIVPFNTWAHILYSVDARTGDCAIYVNDALATTVNNTSEVPFLPDMNGKPFFVGDDTFDTSFIGAMSDLWIAPGVSLLDGTGHIPAATRRRFITSGGKPANPAGFPQSAILFSGNASSFAVNHGSGGSFSLTGALTNVTGPSA